MAVRPSRPGSEPAIAPPPAPVGEATGPVPRLDDGAGDATGPVVAIDGRDDDSGPLRRHDASGASNEALDPPPRPARHGTADMAPSEVPPGLRPSAEHAIPIYPAEELTPPAIDAAELARGDVEHTPRKQ
jgi:hypothetical protein